MRTYARREGYVTDRAMALFERMKADMEAMPDLGAPEDVSCHAVCRVLAARHGVRCVDGFFGGVGNDHSWLDLGDGVIADMYPIGGAAPFLIWAGHWAVPWHALYVERATLLDEGRDRARHETMALLLGAHLEEADRAA